MTADQGKTLPSRANQEALAEFNRKLREDLQKEAMKVDHDSTEEETRIGTLIYHGYNRVCELESQLSAALVRARQLEQQLNMLRRQNNPNWGNPACD